VIGPHLTLSRCLAKSVYPLDAEFVSQAHVLTADIATGWQLELEELQHAASDADGITV
jgi:hypothetical protein